LWNITETFFVDFSHEPFITALPFDAIKDSCPEGYQGLKGKKDPPCFIIRSPFNQSESWHSHLSPRATAWFYYSNLGGSCYVTGTSNDRIYYI